jgi:hypothetical protein
MAAMTVSRDRPNGPRLVSRASLLFAATVTVLAGCSIASAAPTASLRVRPYYEAARTLWLSEAEMVSGALQNVPLVAAAHDLERGLSVRGADSKGYARAIATIGAFERIPLTSETSSQVSASHRDWAALNTFFDVTPAEQMVLDHDLPSGDQYDAARRAWRREPVGVHRGLSATLLRTVVAALQRASSAQPSRSILYTSALVDARSLEGATAEDVASSDRTLLNPYNQDIYYLNVFFQSGRLQALTTPN